MENMHKIFKVWLEKKPHPNSHLSGVDRILRRDLLSRLSSCRKRTETATGPHASAGNMEIMRLFLGE